MATAGVPAGGEATGARVKMRPPSLRGGLRIQFRVVLALILRELHTRYGRENIGYLWLILEPMLLAAMIGMIHARGANHYSSDIKPVPLSLVGYCNFMTFRAIFNRSAGAIEQNMALMYHKTVSVLDIMVARAILEAAGTWMAFFILIGMAIAVGIASLPARPLILLTGMVLMLLLSFGMGLVICGVTHRRPAVARLVSPVSYVMMPLSGAFFTMEMVPGPIRDSFLWIPLPHIFEILRYGWFKSAEYQYIDPDYLAWWIGLSLLLGLLMITTARKRVRMA